MDSGNFSSSYPYPILIGYRLLVYPGRLGLFFRRETDTTSYDSLPAHPVRWQLAHFVLSHAM